MTSHTSPASSPESEFHRFLAVHHAAYLRSATTPPQTKEESDKNRRPHAGNRRCPNLLLRQSQILLDLWQERCDGKPSKECDKEGKPCAVKGSHVWTSKATKVDFLGTILLVLVHRQHVVLVLLPLRLIVSQTTRVR